MSCLLSIYNDAVVYGCHKYKDWNATLHVKEAVCIIEQYPSSFSALMIWLFAMCHN